MQELHYAGDESDEIEFIDDETRGDGASEDNLSLTSETVAKEMVSSEDSIEGAKSKILKLKNINDLLKQIDEQFNSVLKQTEVPSPAHSGCSEPEADRYFKEYLTPPRSPLLPNISSPEPLPSPGAAAAAASPHEAAQKDSPKGSGTSIHSVGAVPYRGIKSNPSSPAVCRAKDDLDYRKPSLPPSSPKTNAFRGSPKLSKLTHPLFDGYPFKKQSNDGLSISEGYHSDPPSLHPVTKPLELRFTPDPNGVYTRAPGSPESPEDLDV
jgi:hypothetical protein